MLVIGIRAMFVMWLPSSGCAPTTTRSLYDENNRDPSGDHRNLCRVEACPCALLETGSPVRCRATRILLPLWEKVSTTSADERMPPPHRRQSRSRNRPLSRRASARHLLPRGEKGDERAPLRYPWPSSPPSRRQTLANLIVRG